MNSETITSRTIRLFKTAPHSCSYLPNRKATTLFVDPTITISQSLHTRLSTMGFRRSGTHIYKPDCETCSACISCRVLVNDFELKRRHKRIFNRNSDLTAIEVKSMDFDESFDLYCNYINARHPDGDMYPPNEEQYASFIAVKTQGARYFKFYAGDKLLAVSVIDPLQNGLSAVYTFFDSSVAERSLGSYVILWQIRLASQLKLPYLYLGYWVRDCQKMSYKSNYRPLELLIDGKWQKLT